MPPLGSLSWEYSVKFLYFPFPRVKIFLFSVMPQHLCFCQSACQINLGCGYLYLYLLKKKFQL